MILECILKTPHLESVNAMYEPIIRYRKIKGTNISYKNFCGMRLATNAALLKNAIADQLKLKNVKVDINEINSSEYPLTLTVSFVLNRNILKRDLDNMLKLTIDGLFHYLGVNDSRIFEIHARKVISEEVDEYVKLELDYCKHKIEDFNVK